MAGPRTESFTACHTTSQLPSNCRTPPVADGKKGQRVFKCKWAVRRGIVVNRGREEVFACNGPRGGVHKRGGERRKDPGSEKSSGMQARKSRSAPAMRKD